MTPQVNISFTKENKLKIILDDKLIDSNFKLCFSLVYSIKSITGAYITKQIGRYYELSLEKNTILLDLQIPRIGNFNLSSGPEGIFIIDQLNNSKLNINVSDLIFEKPIKNKIYEDPETKNFIPIIPEPDKVHLQNEFIVIENKTFNLNVETEIISNLQNIISKLDINLSSEKGFPIFFQNDNQLLEDQYSIQITKDNIEIKYNNYGGKLYGLISLVHLIDFYQTKLPICTIQDNPKYQWRGMHLDCARQFYTIDEIKRLFDYMVLFKLNRFHWHLTDNEAWRIEIKKYPDLALNGGYRGYNFKIPPLYGSGYDKYGGYYSQEDIKELIIYAKKLNIEIMPEIDLPAHSWALLEIMPELREQSSNIVSEDVGSYRNNTINPSLEKTITFLKDMLSEVSSVFSYNVIHVGVDERPSNAWEGSPAIIDFMKKNNIKSQEEYQDYYMNFLIDFLKSQNKRTAAWNEAAVSPHINHGVGGSAGKIDKSCLIFSWEHSDVAKETTNKGFETILCPGQKTYFDMAYNNSTEERGICWAATIEVKDIYEWDPIKDIKKSELIKGLQGQLWSETITEKKFFDQMINPRLATLSEVAWKGKISRKWIEFRSALLNSMNFIKKLGWRYHNF